MSLREYRNKQYVMLVEFPLVTVRSVDDGSLEAFSSSRSDFEQSVQEFLYDYFKE